MTIHEQLWPQIPWREPIRLHVAGHKAGWYCRLCIAEHGFKGDQADSLWDDPEEVRAHIEAAHHEDG